MEVGECWVVGDNIPALQLVLASLPLCLRFASSTTEKKKFKKTEKIKQKTRIKKPPKGHPLPPRSLRRHLLLLP